MTEENKWDTPSLPATVGLGKNRIYEALVKAQNPSEKENLFEISERILEREKENAKKALEEIWLVKKTSSGEDLVNIDLLIDHYQRKVDSVRQREEQLKSIGKESHKLIEDRKKLQKELATITQELESCTQEITFLKAKHEKLRLKEKEYLEKNDSVGSKIQKNEKEVLENLSSIIIARPEAEAARAHAETAASPASTPAPTPSPVAAPEKPAPALAEATPADPNLYQAFRQIKPTRFPKSIVKTERGRVLGEYYYDPKITRNFRSYVFNGRFFVDQLVKGLELHKADEGNSNILNDLTLMAVDIKSRAGTQTNIRFEISTNEILNQDSLNALIENLKTKEFSKVLDFTNRFNKKIERLGQNYEILLGEQLANLASPSNAEAKAQA